MLRRVAVATPFAAVSARFITSDSGKAEHSKKSFAKGDKQAKKGFEKTSSSSGSSSSNDKFVSGQTRRIDNMERTADNSKHFEDAARAVSDRHESTMRGGSGDHQKTASAPKKENLAPSRGHLGGVEEVKAPGLMEGILSSLGVSSASATPARSERPGNYYVRTSDGSSRDPEEVRERDAAHNGYRFKGVKRSDQQGSA